MVPASYNRAFVPAAALPVNRIDSLFNRVFGEDGPAASFGRPVLPLAMWADDDHLWVEAEIPGVAEADVDVTVHKDQLTIRFERKDEEGRRYLYNGRAAGRFEQTITLPEPVHSEGVQATLKDGLLRIDLPKSPEAKPRKIGVNVNAG